MAASPFEFEPQDPPAAAAIRPRRVGTVPPAVPQDTIEYYKESSPFEFEPVATAPGSDTPASDTPTGNTPTTVNTRKQDIGSPTVREGTSKARRPKPRNDDEHLSLFREKNPDFADVASRFIEFARSRGVDDVYIKSGYRTAEEQNFLHRKGYPTKSNDGYIKISPHQDARAIDWSTRNKANKQRLYDLLGVFVTKERERGRRLHIPSDEPWHLAGTPAKNTRAAVQSSDIQLDESPFEFETSARPDVSSQSGAALTAPDPGQTATSQAHRQSVPPINPPSVQQTVDVAPGDEVPAGSAMVTELDEQTSVVSTKPSVVRVPVKEGAQPIDILREGLTQKAQNRGLDKKRAALFANEALERITGAGKDPLNDVDGQSPLSPERLADLYKHGYAEIDVQDPAYDELIEKHLDEQRETQRVEQQQRRVKDLKSQQDSYNAQIELLRIEWRIANAQAAQHADSTLQKKLLEEPEKASATQVIAWAKNQNRFGDMGIFNRENEGRARLGLERKEAGAERVVNGTMQRPPQLSIGDVRQRDDAEIQAQSKLREQIRQQVAATTPSPQSAYYTDKPGLAEQHRQAAIEQATDRQLQQLLSDRPAQEELERQARVAAMPTSEKLKSAGGAFVSGVAEIGASVGDTQALINSLPIRAVTAAARRLRITDYTHEAAKDPWAQLAQLVRHKVAQQFPQHPDLTDEFIYSIVPQAMGSAVGFFGPGVIARSATLVPMMLGISSGASEGYRDAKRHGASENQALVSAVLNGGVGASEAIPTSRWIQRVHRASGGTFSKAFGKYLRETAHESLEEALQEFFQTTAGNVIASKIIAYDKDRGVFDGAFENAFAGAIVGALMSSGTQGAEYLAAKRGTKPAASGTIAPSDGTIEPSGETIGAFIETKPPIGETPAPETMTDPSTESGRDFVQPKPAEQSTSAEPVTENVLETKPESAVTVDEAAHQAAPSPQNNLPEPTVKQKEAGNYQKGHIKVAGLDVSIENPQGSERTGVDASGKNWSVTLQSHYGYIKRTEGTDGEQIDAFIRPGLTADYDGPVFVINQTNGKDGDFDEHKAMLGWSNEDEARAAYLENYAKGWNGIGSVSRFENPEEFKQWLANGDGKKPAPITDIVPGRLEPIKETDASETPAAVAEPGERLSSELIALRDHPAAQRGFDHAKRADVDDYLSQLREVATSRQSTALPSIEKAIKEWRASDVDGSAFQARKALEILAGQEDKQSQAFDEKEKAAAPSKPSPEPEVASADLQNLPTTSQPPVSDEGSVAESEDIVDALDEADDADSDEGGYEARRAKAEAKYRAAKPWTMSEEEYDAWEDTLEYHERPGAHDNGEHRLGYMGGQKAAVYKAIKAGEAVPDEVLERFPELKALKETGKTLAQVEREEQLEARPPIGTEETDKSGERIVYVDPARLQHDYQNANKKDGDIAAAYSGDKLSDGKIRKPFEFEGQQWVNVGGGGPTESYRAYRLIPAGEFKGKTYSHSEKKGPGYDGTKVTWQKKPYVLQGPLVHFYPGHATKPPVKGQATLAPAEPEAKPAKSARPDVDEDDFSTGDSMARQALAHIWQNYENGEVETAEDVTVAVEELIEDYPNWPATPILRAALEKYRHEQKEDAEQWGKRGDSEAAEEEFLAAVEGQVPAEWRQEAQDEAVEEATPEDRPSAAPEKTSEEPDSVGDAAAGGTGTTRSVLPSHLEKGESQTVKTERGTTAQIKPAVIDAKDLITSLDAGYPSQFQPRDRTRAASKAQISRIANNLDTDFLGDSPKASDGRPLVLPIDVDGKTKYAVISGNGRVAGIKEAYELHVAEEYRDFASKKAGLIYAHGKPVYVGVLHGDQDWVKFAREANESGVARMSAVEQAIDDAKAITPELMAKFHPADDGNVNTIDNRDFIRDFVTEVAGTDQRSQLLTDDGRLSVDGVNRVRNAIFAKAYGTSTEGVNALAKIAEDPDNNVRQITNALLRHAGAFAELKENIAHGTRHDLDISEDLVKAAAKLSALREDKMSVEHYLKQGGMFDSLDTLQRRILVVLDENSRSTRAINDILDNYLRGANAAGNPLQPGMFAATNLAPAIEPLWDAAIEETKEISDEAKRLLGLAGIAAPRPRVRKAQSDVPKANKTQPRNEPKESSGNIVEGGQKPAKRDDAEQLRDIRARQLETLREAGFELNDRVTMEVPVAGGLGGSKTMTGTIQQAKNGHVFVRLDDDAGDYNVFGNPWEKLVDEWTAAKEELGADDSLSAIEKLYAAHQELVDRILVGDAKSEDLSKFNVLAEQFGVSMADTLAIIDEGGGYEWLTNEIPQGGLFKVKNTPLIGSVSRYGEVRARPDPDFNKTHEKEEDLEYNYGENWRYAPGTKTVYWTDNELPDQEYLLAVENWLERRGYEVLNHDVIEQLWGITARDARGLFRVEDSADTFRRLETNEDEKISKLANALLIWKQKFARGAGGELAMQDLARALDKLAYLKTVNLTVEEYENQPPLFDGVKLTSHQQGMLRLLEKYEGNRGELKRIVGGYLRDVETGEGEFDESHLVVAEQGALFKRDFDPHRKSQFGEKVAKALFRSEQDRAARALMLTTRTLAPLVEVKRSGHRLKLNPEAYELLRREYEKLEFERTKQRDVPPFTGVFFERNLVKKLVRNLTNLTREDPSHKPIGKLVKAIKAAAADNGTVILYTTENVLKHEGFHYASDAAAAHRDLMSRHGDFDSLLDHPAFEKASDTLIKMGAASPLEPALIVEEIAAYSYGGDYEKLGLTDEEAADYLNAWFDSFVKKNGRASLEVFARERAEAERLIARAAEARGERDRDVRRISEGRQGRDSEEAPADERGPEDAALFRADDDGRIDPREKLFRALYRARNKTYTPDANRIRQYVESVMAANRAARPLQPERLRGSRGRVGGYFSKTAPKAQPIPQLATPTAPPPPNQPPQSIWTDQELMESVDRALADPHATGYISRIFRSAKKLPRELQRYFTAEYTPLRLAEEQLDGRRRVDLAAKAELLAGASGKAELDVLRLQARVVAPIARISKHFNRYLLLKRVVDRLHHDSDRKKVADWTVEKAEAALEALKRKIGDVDWKRIEKAAQAFQEETDLTLQLRVDAGMISQEAYDAIKASNDFYAPFKVMKYVTEEMTKPAGSGRRIPHTQDLIKRITGIEDQDFQVQDFVLTAAQQIYQTRILAEKNRFVRDDFAPLADADSNGEILRRAQPTRYYRIEYKPAEEILEQLAYQRQPVEQSFVKVGRAIELAEQAGLTVSRRAMEALGRADIGGMETGGSVNLKAFTSEVISHELGHSADVLQRDGAGNPITKTRNVFGTRRDILQRLSSDINTRHTFQKELKALVAFTGLGGDAKYQASAKERFAEFIELYIHNPKKARLLAPTWTNYFELKFLPLPTVKNLVEGLSNVFQKVDALPNVLTPLKELDNHNYLELAIRRAFPDRAPQLGVRFGDKPRQGYKIIEYLEHGNVQALEVRDDVAKALEGLHRGEASVVSRAAMIAAQPFRWGATAFNLAFQPVNLFLADLPRAAFISKYGLRRPEDLVRFPADWIYSFMTSMAGNFGFRSNLYEEFMNSGAYNSTIQRELTPEAFKPQLGVGRQGLVKRGLFSVVRIGSAIEETSKLLGIMRGRRFERLSSLPAEQRAERMREIASEVRRYSGSPDFWRKGVVSTGQTLENMNLLFMFFNARMQGTALDLARLAGRTGGGRHGAAAWARLAIAVGIPALTLMLYNLDDDEIFVDGPEGPWRTTNRESYNQVPDNERENYFMIPRAQYFVNDRGERVRDYWKIPKREIVKLFANLIEAGVKFADERDSEHLKEFGISFLENISPINISGTTMMERAESVVGSTNPIIKTPAELIFNRDTFRHRNIVPDYIDKVKSQDLPPEEQYTRSTPPAFVKLGSYLGMSPLLIEHGTRGFTAGLVTQFLPPKAQPGRAPILSWPAVGPVARRFVRSESTAKESDNEILDEALKNQATEKVTRNREARDLYDTWKKTAKDTPIKDWLKGRGVKPEIGVQVLSLKEDDDKNLTQEERLVKRLGVENGERADYLRKQLEGKSDEEKLRLIQEWTEKGLVSKNVERQLRLTSADLQKRTDAREQRTFIRKANQVERNSQGIRPRPTP